MASLVESGADLLPHLDEEKMQYMAFTEAISFAEQFESPLYDLHEETFRELYLRPSPPLSPDDCEPSCSQSPVEETPTNSQPSQEQARGLQDNVSTDAMADSLISNIMEYEQIMDALQEAEFALSSGSSQPAEDLLIQDCMWSASSSDDNRTNSGGTDKNVTDSSSTGTGTEPSSSAECCVVKPSAVFPNLHHAAPQTVRVPNNTPLALSNRLQSIQSSSESEEEIDVVTVDHNRSDSQESDDPPKRQSSILQTQQQHSKPVKPVSNVPHGQSKSTKKTTAQVTQTRSVQSPTIGSGGSKSTARKKRAGKRHSRLGSNDGGNESDEEARRASHNVLERKRRNDLKNSFDILRTGIPDLEENIRAPKVVILRKAVEYIKYLQVNDRKIECDWSREQKRYNKLQERLLHLKKKQIVAI